MTVDELLATLVARFNRHAEQTPAVREELAGLERTIALHVSDGASYTIELRDGRLQDLRVGNSRSADLTVTTDSLTFVGLVRKEIGPMKAIVTRKLAIEGSLEDKLLFRRLLR